MNREKELAKNTIILAVGKMCTQFISFILLPLYTALLVPDEFGIVDLFNTYISLLTPIFNCQFENGLFRFMLDFRGDYSKQKSLFSTIVIANLGQAAIYLVFFFIAQPFISSEYKIFLALDVVANIFLNTLLQFPRGLGNNLVYSIGSFISATLTVVLNVLFIAGLRWGALGMFSATVSAKALTGLYLIIATKTWRYFSFKAADRSLLMSVSKYSLPLVPNRLSWWVVGASDRIIVAHFIDVAANGIYSVANKFSSVYVTFYSIFDMSWTESVSLHMEDEDSDEFLTDTINTMFNLIAAIAIGIIACMPFIFNVMINEKYADAYYQIPILMLAGLFQAVVGLYSVIYVALKKSSEIAKTSIFAAVINIVIDLLLVKFIGLYAASISTLVAYGAMAFYRYFDVKKYVMVPLKTKNLIISVLVAMISLLTYYYRNTFLQVIGLVVVVIYAVLINKHFLLSVLRGFIKKIKKN